LIKFNQQRDSVHDYGALFVPVWDLSVDGPLRVYRYMYIYIYMYICIYVCVCYIHTPTYTQICRYSLLDLPVTKVGMTLRVETQPKFVYRNIKTVLKTDDRQVFQVLGLDVINKSELVNGGVSVPTTPSHFSGPIVCRSTTRTRKRRQNVSF
jgi:hypothetical protein